MIYDLDDGLFSGVLGGYPVAGDFISKWRMNFTSDFHKMEHSGAI